MTSAGQLNSMIDVLDLVIEELETWGNLGCVSRLAQGFVELTSLDSPEV